MKNYITVAALLAAGTAFANADTALIDVDFTNYGNWAAAKEDGWSQEKMSTVGYHGTDAVVNSSLGLTTGGAWTRTRVSHDLASSIDLGTDGKYTITYTATKGDNNAALQFALVGTNYSIVVGSSYNTDPGLYAGIVGDANVLTSTSSWYVFQNKEEDGVVEIAKGETISTDAIVNTELTYTLTLTTSADGNDTLEVSAGNGSSSYTGTYTFSSDAELTAVGFMLEADLNIRQSVEGVSVVSSAIPEPSAFGLLAGLGALALVASRRRRK